MCNGQLTDMRCLMVEKMLDKLPKTKCIFPECSFKRADNQAVLDHQEECIHREAPCGRCGESVAMSSLNQHLVTHDIHDPVPQGMWDMYFSWDGQITISPVELDGVSFYFNSVHLNDSTLMVWVSYNGPKKDCKKYQFSIELVDWKRAPKTVALSATKFCVPCDMSRAVVKEKYLGVIIDKDLAKVVDIGGNLNNLRFKIDVQFFPTRLY